MGKIDAKASVRYFRATGGGRPFDAGDMTETFVTEVEALRDEVRREEGGGGYCHVMSELMQLRYGWPMLSVAYLDRHGDVICAAHVVNVLPGGGILDTTRDQFGEGFSVSLIGPDDPEIGRYRPEFYQDFHPGHPDDDQGYLDAWLDSYDGLDDYREQDRHRAERGDGWWLADLSRLCAYREEQRAFAAAEPSGRRSTHGRTP